MKNKVSSEIKTELSSDGLPLDSVSLDGLPSYEQAIEMPADYIHIPIENSIVDTSSTISTSENCQGENDVRPEIFRYAHRTLKNDCLEKLFIIILIFFIFSLIFIFLLFS